MLVSRANGFRGGLGAACACTFALVAGCAGGEEVGESAGAGGASAPRYGGGGQPAVYAGGAAGRSGSSLSTGGSGGVGGLLQMGGSSGAGGLTGAGGAGGSVGIDGGAGGAAGASGATVGDGATGCGLAGTEHSPVTDGGITLRYRNQDGGAKGTAIQFDLEITTSLAAGVTLGDVEIRYYFTNEIGDPLVTEMYWAGTGADTLTSAVKTAIVPMPAAVPGADTYAAYTLPASAVKLVAGSTLTIKPALHKAGYSASFNQCDDYSYGVGRDFIAFSRIAVFVKGALAWGSVPAPGVAADGSTDSGGAGDADASEASIGDGPAPDAAEASIDDAASEPDVSAIDAPGE